MIFKKFKADKNFVTKVALRGFTPPQLLRQFCRWQNRFCGLTHCYVDARTGALLGNEMKTIQLKNDDYKGYVNNLRHACRGIIINNGNVLLCYESNEDKYIIPGGGQEENETLEQCCQRELLEETGMIVKTNPCYLEIEELFLDWRHINHYFVCEIIEDTGTFHLTENEKQAGYKTVWIPLDKAIEIFGNYETFHKTNIADYGLYRREFFALNELKKILKDEKSGQV